MGKLEKIVVGITALVAIIVVSGTTFAFISGTRARKLLREDILRRSASSSGPSAKATKIFEGLGTIRTKSADTDPAVIAAQIVFSYDPTDRAFSEELFTKKDALRKATIMFFAGKRASELDPPAENALKAGLRDTLNALLSLGKINELYFSQFDVLH